VLPLGRDQAFNARRVEQLDAAIRLTADAPHDEIRVALSRLLDEPRFRAAAARAARRIVADEPDRIAAEALERTARRG
jgi:UDP:flavonoid glycosyltransferase YjiC (YdhE family)